MALGISERAIKEAYGPVDWSGFYKGINEGVRRAQAEDKAKKQAAQKEYFTTSAVLSKDMAGIRDADNSEIMGHYNNWKVASQKLMSNPNLIESNPEEYGKLSAQANESYAKAMQTIEASKVKKKDHEAIAKHMLDHPDDYEDGARDNFIKVTRQPVSKLIENNDDDIEKYKYSGPNANKYFSQITDIYSKGVTNARIIKYKDDKEGVVIGTEVQIPDIMKIQNGVSNLLDSWGSRREKASKSILNNSQQEYSTVAQNWDNLDDKYFEQFKDSNNKDMFPEHQSPITGKMTRKPDLIFNSPYASVNLSSYLQAKGVMGMQPKEGKPIEDFGASGGSIKKKQLLGEVALSFSKRLADYKLKNDLYKQKTGYSMKNDIMMNDRELENEYKLITSLVGKEEARNIGDYQNLTPDKIAELDSKIKSIREKFGFSASQRAAKEQKPKEETDKTKPTVKPSGLKWH